MQGAPSSRRRPPLACFSPLSIFGALRGCHRDSLPCTRSPAKISATFRRPLTPKPMWSVWFCFCHRLDHTVCGGPPQPRDSLPGIPTKARGSLSSGSPSCPPIGVVQAGARSREFPTCAPSSSGILSTWSPKRSRKLQSKSLLIPSQTAACKRDSTGTT